MGRFGKMIVNSIRTFDLFPTTQFLRYKGDASYGTTTGGCTSIGLIVIFFILFTSMGIQTARQEIIYSSVDVDKEASPSPIQIEFNRRKDFMVGISIADVNLSHPNVTYFEFQMTYKTKDHGNWSQKTVPMQPCSREHFGSSEETKQAFEYENGSSWLCPPSNVSFILQGKETSSVFSFVEVKIKKCDPDKHLNCANISETQTNLGGDFKAKVMLVSNMINPENQIYHKPTLQARNQFFFTTKSAIDIDGFIEETTVNTDYGYITSYDITTELYLCVTDFFLGRQRRVVDDTYLTMRLQKSPVCRVFERHFNKLDNFMAYVGGIVGTFIALIVVLRAYSEQAYAVSLASQLYTTQEQETISSTWFHIGYLVMIPVRNLISRLGCWKDSWPKTDFYRKCINQVNEQIDIVSIMKKLIFMEKAFTLLFTENQLEALHLFEKEKIEDACRLRKKYDLEKKIKTTHFRPNNEELRSQEQDMGSQSSKKYKGNEVVPHNVEIQSGQLSAASMSNMPMGSHLRLKTQLNRLMDESKQGNMVSSQIMGGLSIGVLKKIGFAEYGQEQSESKKQKETPTFSKHQFAIKKPSIIEGAKNMRKLPPIIRKKKSLDSTSLVRSNTKQEQKAEIESESVASST